MIPARSKPRGRHSRISIRIRSGRRRPRSGLSEAPRYHRAMRSWIVAISISTAAFAQQSQNAYEPRNAIGAGQALLAQFAGNWDVVKTFYPQKGEPVVTRGTCRMAMIHEGHFLQSDFTFFD